MRPGSRGSGRSSGRQCSSSGSELRLPRLYELTIVRWIEVEKRPTRSKMLDENLADHPGSASGGCWHSPRPDHRSDARRSLYEAARSGRDARRGHRSRQASKDRFAPIFGKWNFVNLRKTAQPIKLEPTDCGDVEKGHRDETSSSRPKRQAVN